MPIKNYVNKIQTKKLVAGVALIAAVTVSVGYGVGKVTADNGSNQATSTQNTVSVHAGNSSSVASSIVTANVKGLSGNSAKQASEIQNDSKYKYATNLGGNAKKAQNAVLKDGIASVKQQQANNQDTINKVAKQDNSTVKAQLVAKTDAVQQMRAAIRNSFLDDTVLTDDQIRVLITAYQHEYGTGSTAKVSETQWAQNEGSTGLDSILQAALSVAPASK